MKFLFVPALLLGSVAIAQKPVTVKPSPASDALNHAAQDLATEQKSFDTLLNQARSNADAGQKQIQTELQKANADLTEELKADKKYKDKIEAIITLQKQSQNANQQIETKFNQEAGPISNQMTKDRAMIDGLVPVVRKENDLPPTATFDPGTQKWTDKAEDKSAEPKTSVGYDAMPDAKGNCPAGMVKLGGIHGEEVCQKKS